MGAQQVDSIGRHIQTGGHRNVSNLMNFKLCCWQHDQQQLVRHGGSACCMHVDHIGSDISSVDRFILSAGQKLCVPFDSPACCIFHFFDKMFSNIVTHGRVSFDSSLMACHVHQLILSHMASLLIQSKHVPYRWSKLSADGSGTTP